MLVDSSTKIKKSSRRNDEEDRTNENVPQNDTFLTCCLNNKSAQQRKIFDTLLHPRDITQYYSDDLLALTRNERNRF